MCARRGFRDTRRSTCLAYEWRLVDVQEVARCEWSASMTSARQREDGVYTWTCVRYTHLPPELRLGCCTRRGIAKETRITLPREVEQRARCNASWTAHHNLSSNRALLCMRRPRHVWHDSGEICAWPDEFDVHERTRQARWPGRIKRSASTSTIYSSEVEADVVMMTRTDATMIGSASGGRHRRHRHCKVSRKRGRTSRLRRVVGGSVIVIVRGSESREDYGYRGLCTPWRRALWDRDAFI